MNRAQARALQRTIEELLDGNEIGLLRAEESPHIPDYWGVTLKLTSKVDWPVLSRAIGQTYGAYEEWIAASPARAAISFDQYVHALARHTLARVPAIDDPVVSEVMAALEASPHD